MKSWTDIKSEINQGVKEERSIGRQKTLNEREMGSWDKEVQKTKGRYDSSKEIKDLLHFGFFLSAFAAIIALWKADTSPLLKVTPIWNKWSWQIGLPQQRGCFSDWREGPQTVGTLRRDKDTTVIGCCSLLFLNLQPQGVMTRRKKKGLKQTATITEFLVSTNHKLMTEMLCACVRTIWQICP